MKERACCFTGHRIIADDPAIKTRLAQVVAEYADWGITTFLAGGAIGFDMLAAQTVLELKVTRPHLRLELILPCRGQSEGWTRAQKFEYNRILRLADSVEYVSDEYTPLCMKIRNVELVNRSSVCVCYYLGRPGGTQFTVGYAEERGLEVRNIAEELDSPSV